MMKDTKEDFSDEITDDADPGREHKTDPVKVIAIAFVIGVYFVIYLKILFIS